MSYLPNTDEDRRAMLDALGVESIDDLFACIPEGVRFRKEMDLPPAMSELELVRHMKTLAGRNVSTEEMVCFLGAGAYDHFLPAVVDHMLSREEFYTAYTPYQPEVSQGTLQVIFEFQTLISELTGMDVANASMYDGATALMEAALMAGRIVRRGDRVVVSESVHPRYRRVLATYLRGLDWDIVEVPAPDGVTDTAALREAAGEGALAVIVQNPNFFGMLEPVDEISEAAGDAQFVVACDPISLGVLRPPGGYGADIVVGEGQPLGNPLSFGGPYLGFFASGQKHIRRMPGRLIGRTVEVDGTRGFVMTLQAREHHIRRDRATSNICTNEALNALAATVYLSAMGRRGLREVAEQSLQKAHYAARIIDGLKGYRLRYDQPFFKEFVVECDRPAAEVVSALAGEGILAGLDLGRFYPGMQRSLLVAVTEKRTKDEIDEFAGRLEGLS
ncbi:MAG: aminomethyl-transferring glycine dehydrogenase subunit GcvPA [Bacillota bacterium]